MNDLGWTLAWLSLQVAALLVPALAFQARAARRAPALGAWVATWSLGLVVTLGAAACWPSSGTLGGQRIPPQVEGGAAASLQANHRVAPVAAIGGDDSTRSRGLVIPWRAAWDRLGRQAAGPAARRVRPWGRAIAVVVLAGMGCGLLRLSLGLWAIGQYRRRGRGVDDPALLALVAELRGAMGCRRAVGVRAVGDLATAATAGWRHPLILLPDDWQSWTEAERRAVVAHELAHIVRGDYAAGLLARVAVVCNYHHPLVRWMAGRLQLNQELAADALGAQFAGGHAAYLVALASLALKQDGRSPNWLARAFLPARGTLIRRIAMLRNETPTDLAQNDWSRAKRLASALGLATLAVAMATCKAPAEAGDDTPPPHLAEAKTDTPTAPVATNPPFDTTYMPDSARGIVAFRPAAIMRRPGGDRLAALVREQVREFEVGVAKGLHVDTQQAGFLQLGGGDIESVVLNYKIGVKKVPPQQNEPEQLLHTIESDSLTVRTMAAFDWLAFFRQWKLQVTAIPVGAQAYYQVMIPEEPASTMSFFVYLPDDRTLVINEPETIRQHLARAVPAAPAYLREYDWERASRGLLAIAIDNRDDRFVKPYERAPAEPEDKAVLELFAGIDRWIIGVPDAPTLSVIARATPRNLRAGLGVMRAINALAELGRVAATSAPAGVIPNEAAMRVYRGLLANLQIGAAGGGVTVGAQHFGTLGDIAEMIRVQLAVEAEAAKVPAQPRDGAVRPAGGGADKL